MYNETNIKVAKKHQYKVKAIYSTDNYNSYDKWKRISFNSFNDYMVYFTDGYVYGATNKVDLYKFIREYELGNPKDNKELEYKNYMLKWKTLPHEEINKLLDTVLTHSVGIIDCNTQELTSTTTVEGICECFELYVDKRKHDDMICLYDTQEPYYEKELGKDLLSVLQSLDNFHELLNNIDDENESWESNFQYFYKSQEDKYTLTGEEYQELVLEQGMVEKESYEEVQNRKSVNKQKHLTNTRTNNVGKHLSNAFKILEEREAKREHSQELVLEQGMTEKEAYDVVQFNINEEKNKQEKLAKTNEAIKRLNAKYKARKQFKREQVFLEWFNSKYPNISLVYNPARFTDYKDTTYIGAYELHLVNMYDNEIRVHHRLAPIINSLIHYINQYPIYSNIATTLKRVLAEREVNRHV